LQPFKRATSLDEHVMRSRYGGERGTSIPPRESIAVNCRLGRLLTRRLLIDASFILNTRTAQRARINRFGTLYACTQMRARHEDYLHTTIVDVLQ
jgi:hypothetical protein